MKNKLNNPHNVHLAAHVVFQTYVRLETQLNLTSSLYVYTAPDIITGGAEKVVIVF
jgi:hypothetical protein